MDCKNSITICRICLEVGAGLPIFESIETEKTISQKLSVCLREKVEDIDGYPRNICTSCDNMLDTIIKFINKYKESCRLLQQGSESLIKQETISEDYDNFYDQSEVEVLEDIKTEAKLEIDEVLLKLKPCHVSIKKVKVEPVTKKTKVIEKLKSFNKTNKIASSILEGDFSWSGTNWCLMPKNQLKISSNKKQLVTVKHAKERQDPVIKLNKKPKPQAPPKLCDLCGAVFKNQDRLTHHQKSKHFNEPQQCPKCNKICRSSYYLGRHLKRKHTENGKDNICVTCGKRFAFAGELNNHHRKVHEKHLNPPKAFTCKFCDKTYKCAKSVLIHERSVHTGDRPAVCNVCGNSFYHEDYLKEHMRLHTGETPYKCPICDRGYAQRGNMKSHLRNHRISELDSITLSKLRPNYLKRLKP